MVGCRGCRVVPIVPLGSRLEVETSHHFFVSFFSLLVKRLVGDFKGRQWTASWMRIRALNVFEKRMQRLSKSPWLGHCISPMRCH